MDEHSNQRRLYTSSLTVSSSSSRSKAEVANDFPRGNHTSANETIDAHSMARFASQRRRMLVRAATDPKMHCRVLLVGVFWPFRQLGRREMRKWYRCTSQGRPDSFVSTKAASPQACIAFDPDLFVSEAGIAVGTADDDGRWMAITQVKLVSHYRKLRASLWKAAQLDTHTHHSARAARHLGQLRSEGRAFARTCMFC